MKSISTYLGPQIVVENYDTLLASLQLTQNGVVEITGTTPRIISSTTDFRIYNSDQSAELELSSTNTSVSTAGDITFSSGLGVVTLTLAPTVNGGSLLINGDPGSNQQLFTSSYIDSVGVYHPISWTTPNYNNPQTATLVAGTVSITDVTVTASTTVLVTVQTPGGTQGFLSVAVTAGTGFVINSTSATDTSTVAYMRVG